MAGARRLMHPEEQVRLAQQHGIPLTAPLGEICFERATQTLTLERLQPALERALDLEGARIEVLDFARYAIPPGELVFTRAGLSPSGWWRGLVEYAEGRTAPIWVRARVTTEQRWVEATKPLPAGREIQADQVVQRHGPRFPFGPVPLDSTNAAIGRAPVRSIESGAVLFGSMLETPREVERGDKVTVEVLNGVATLTFEATAEASGRAGESILIRNPESGRLFQARVEARRRVVIRL